MYQHLYMYIYDVHVHVHVKYRYMYIYMYSGNPIEVSEIDTFISATNDSVLST